MPAYYGRLRHGDNFEAIAFPTHVRIDALFSGVALSYFTYFSAKFRHQARKAWTLLLGILLSSLLFFVTPAVQLTVAYVGFFCVVAWAANHPLSGGFLAKSFAWVGRYSYSIYLWHVVPAVVLAALHWRGRLAFLAYGTAGIILGAVMTELVEQPALRLREKFVPSQSSSTAHAGVKSGPLMVLTARYQPQRLKLRGMKLQLQHFGFRMRQELMQTRNQSLDVLRGLAVLMVIVSHYSGFLSAPSALLETGWVGVDLFFVLSGYLISGLLFSEFKKTGGIGLKRFWIRRAFKIYPPFYVLIGVTALVGMWRNSQISYKLLMETLFLQNYVAHFWSHTWSLAVEEHFYFMLPVLLLLLIRIGKSRQNPFRPIPFISMGLSVLCVCLRWLAFVHGKDWAHIAFPTHLRIDALFAGVVLGYYAHFDQESFREAGRPWVLAMGAVFFAAFFVMPDVPRLTFAYVGFSFIVAWAVNQQFESQNRLARIFAWIGYYSYSIYLWHVVLIVGLKEHGGSLVSISRLPCGNDHLRLPHGKTHRHSRSED